MNIEIHEDRLIRWFQNGYLKQRCCEFEISRVPFEVISSGIEVNRFVPPKKKILERIDFQIPAQIFSIRFSGPNTHDRFHKQVI